MAGTADASCSYSSIAPSSTYDVFLNIRGKDTRKGFAGHLHNALKSKGINVFMDSHKLREGEEIGPKLIEAIQGSTISIPVFSKGYADSKWCLIELAQILECSISNHQTVLPIFFDVEPSDVRYQTRNFEKAFHKHDRNVPPHIVEHWREALKKIGNMKGWVLNEIGNGDEPMLIELVVERVFRETSSIYLSEVKYPVGLDSRVNDLRSLVNIGSKGVRFVGIWGEGGIGKTTIAKAFYNRFVKSFHQKCFLANIREEALKGPTGLVSLQEKLIYCISKMDDTGKLLSVYHGREEIRKRCQGENVLLILDDVDDRSQLDALALDLKWLGQGSRVIITTRNEHILNVASVDKENIYRPKELDDIHSLQLFSWHAFQQDKPVEEYEELSSDVACYSGGLPLTLEVLGSYLLDIKSKEEWESTLQNLREVPHKDVYEKLKISFDNLENDNQRAIFLDAACFFVGWKKDVVMSIWEACGYHPKGAIKKLIQRSLLKFTTKEDSEEYLGMHDQIRGMGMELGKHSRLWSFDRIVEVLEGQKGAENIKGILLPSLSEYYWPMVQGFRPVHLYREGFAKMSDLRFLNIDGADFDGDFPELPYGLRWFSWGGCPLKDIPANFYHKRLVHLNLSTSRIQLAWNVKPQNGDKKFQNLKVLQLSRCRSLSKCPDFSWFPYLEQLDLSDCDFLGDVDESIGQLSYLKSLNLSHCESLSELPWSIGQLSYLKSLNLSHCESLSELPWSIGQLSSLESLNLSSCESLNKLPQSIGDLKSLDELQLRDTRIDELPDGVGLLEKLKVLSVEDCKNLLKLPRSMERMSCLHRINLNGTSISKLPDDFLMLSGLVELCMSGNVQEQFNICTLPIHFSGFPQLRKLKLSACKWLESLPADLSDLMNLQELCLGGWEKLRYLPKLPSSLTTLECVACKSLAQLPDLSSQKSLRTLLLFSCYKLEKIRGLEGGIESLELFWVERCYKLTDTPRKQYFQVRPLDNGLKSYVFPSPRCLGALRRLTSLTQLGWVRDYSSSIANDGIHKRLFLIIVFAFPLHVKRVQRLQEGELVDFELGISTDILRKDGRSTRCYQTILIENVVVNTKRDIIYIHDLEGFTWFGFPLGGKDAMTELSVKGCRLWKHSDSGVYRRLFTNHNFVNLKFWSLEYVNEESGRALPNQEWGDKIVKDILSGPWSHVHAGARYHTVFESHSALIEEEDFGSMQHILRDYGRNARVHF